MYLYLHKLAHYYYIQNEFIESRCKKCIVYVYSKELNSHNSIRHRVVPKKMRQLSVHYQPVNFLRRPEICILVYFTRTVFALYKKYLHLNGIRFFGLDVFDVTFGRPSTYRNYHSAENAN